jgi:mannose-6-phosphate isomerase
MKKERIIKINTKKPWGGYETLTRNINSTVKILVVKPRQRFSLQKHKHRDEFWKIIDNPVKITVGKKTFKAKRGDEPYIKRGQLHRAQAYSKTVHILEISFGNFDEKDIIRIEDDYGRN